MADFFLGYFPSNHGDVDPNQHGDFGRFLYEFPMILAFFALRIHIIVMNLDPGGQNYMNPIHITASDIG